MKKILSYKKHPIDETSNMNYVWFRRLNGWSNGKYLIEIYSLKDSFELISSGQYDIL